MRKNTPQSKKDRDYELASIVNALAVSSNLSSLMMCVDYRPRSELVKRDRQDRKNPPGGDSSAKECEKDADQVKTTGFRKSLLC